MVQCPLPDDGPLHAYKQFNCWIFFGTTCCLVSLDVWDHWQWSVHCFWIWKVSRMNEIIRKTFNFPLFSVLILFICTWKSQFVFIFQVCCGYCVLHWAFLDTVCCNSKMFGVWKTQVGTHCSCQRKLWESTRREEEKTENWVGNMAWTVWLSSQFQTCDSTDVCWY